jgi:hypothetical protein
MLARRSPPSKPWTKARKPTRFPTIDRHEVPQSRPDGHHHSRPPCWQEGHHYAGRGLLPRLRLPRQLRLVMHDPEGIFLGRPSIETAILSQRPFSECPYAFSLLRCGWLNMVS